MPKDLRPSELVAEHVELLPARTLVTALLIPAGTSGADIALGAWTSGGVDNSPPQSCSDIPWWAPKPPDCK
jgi:hypothetical protein